MTSTQHDPNPAYLQTIWTLMIAFGAALSYDGCARYSTVLDVDVDLTADILTKLQAGIAVDYARCTDPAEKTAAGWAGTLADYDITVRYLSGTLTLTDDTVCRWGAVVPDDLGFAGLLRLLTDLRLAVPFEGAVEALDARVGDVRYGMIDAEFGRWAGDR